MNSFLDTLHTFTVRIRHVAEYELVVHAPSINDAPGIAVDAFREMSPDERAKCQVSIPCGQTLKVEEVQP
jgi:hypothetical protein